MPLEKEYSIVADSTCSSPPSPMIDAPTENKRVVRTYGRRREEPHASEADPSNLLSEKSGLMHNSVHNTAPPGLADEIPPSTPPANIVETDADPSDRRVVDEGEDTESTITGIPKLNFGWREKLRAMDDDDDDDDLQGTEISIPTFDDAPSQSAFGQPLLLQSIPNTLVLPSTSNEREPKSCSLSTSVAENTYNPDPFSAPAATPHGSSPKPSYSLSSPSAPRPLHSRGRIRKAIVQDSESEQELPKDSSSTAASGSSKRKSRSPSTQPTSEDEMPLRIGSKSQSTGKRKSTQALRPSVPPLQFTEDPASDLKKGSVPKKKKAKAPTIKEKEEMLKERGRLAAQAPVSIHRTETTSKYSKEHLFSKISAKHILNQQTSTSKLPTSDPIASFSSPMQMQAKPDDPRFQSTLRHLEQSIHRSPSPVHHDPAEDSDLPEIGDVLTAESRENTNRKNLLAMKLRALEKKNPPIIIDDDDDLEIIQSPKVVVKEEESHRRAVQKRPSEGRKRQMHLAKINPTKQAAKVESPVRRKEQKESSLSALHHGGSLDSKKLNQILAAEAQKNARLEMERKAAEWKKFGGRTGSNPEGAQKLTSVLQLLAEQGLKNAEGSAAGRADIDMDEVDDQSDSDWDPELRGSASPEPVEETGEDDQDQEEEGGDENLPPTAETHALDDFDNQDDEGSCIRPTRRAVITSDSDSEEDKENDNGFLYDRNEDKENTAIVRHEPLAVAQRSSFSSRDLSSPSVSPTTRPRAWGTRNQTTDLDDDLTPNRRRPLEDLISDETPISNQILSSNLTQSFTAKLQQASPLPSTLSSAPTLNPLFAQGSSSGDFGGGFSQFSQVGGDPFGPAPLLQPGFSDLFESGTQFQKSSSARSDEKLSSKQDAKKVHRPNTLDLTQDFNAVVGLQPAFQAGDKLLRKADAIFEKEQEFVMEDARKDQTRKKPELYVNDHGFLTQTKPVDSSPEIYRPSSTQGLLTKNRAPLSSTKMSARAPLRTLSMTSSYPESPTQLPPRRRLRRLSHTPPPVTNIESSPEPTRKKRNAFDILRNGVQKLKERDEKKHRPELAAYVENEAAESDDEAAFGFVKPRNAEDDEDGEDLDATLEELMDDKVLDENTIAPDLVHAKFMEQLEVQDQEDEKFHQGLIQGEQRLKRRRGVEVDDSDEETDLEENERARRAMKKLRKSDRGDIKSLEKNEATRAFADSYNQTLKDDDTEFLYLEKDTAVEDIVTDRMQMDEDNEDSEEEAGEPETISHDEIVRQIRQNKKEEIKEDSGMDLHDVSWVEEDEEEAPRVKTVNNRVRPKARLQSTTEQFEIDGAAFRKPANPSTSSSSKQWYAQEHKSRNAGTSRSVGGSAITGHAKAKSKAGNGPARAGSMAKRSAASSSTSTGSRSVKGAPSMLSVISDKSRHFA